MNRDLILRKADRGLGFQYVKGGLVTRVQEALIPTNPRLEIDGIFGKDTEAAVKVWQGATGVPQTGEIAAADWRMLLKDEPPELFQRCLQVTSWLEGHGFEKAAGAYDEGILTWGIIGFTLASGNLKWLFGQIDRRHDNLVEELAGKTFADKIKELLEAADGTAQKDVVDEMSVAGKPQELQSEWAEGFEKLGKDLRVQAIQLERAREKYWRRAEQDAARLNLTGPLSLALCLDIAVQCGGVDNEEEAAWRDKTTATMSLAERRKTLANIVAEASRKEWIEDVRARKITLAEGIGKVRGVRINVADWGLADSPEVVAPAIMSTPRGRLAAYLGGLGLKRLKPAQLTFLGRNHGNEEHAAYGLNKIPDEALWPNIAPTALVLDHLCQLRGTDAVVLSAYRSPQYNAKVQGSAKFSMHMKFNAIDFVLKDGAKRTNWEQDLAQLHVAGLFDGHFYASKTKNFVHLDTRRDIA